MGEVETGVNDYSQQQPQLLTVYFRDTPLTLADEAITAFSAKFRHKPIDNLIRLLEERDQLGLTDMIHEINALVISVDPKHSIKYIAELALMTPHHYLVTLECEQQWTHILRIDSNSPDILLREVKDPNLRGIFRSLNEIYPVGAKSPIVATWARFFE